MVSKMVLRNKIVETKVFLAVEEDELFEKNQEGPADPESVFRRDDNEVNVAFLTGHTFRELAGHKNAAHKGKLRNKFCHESGYEPSAARAPFVPFTLYDTAIVRCAEEEIFSIMR